jgi:UDPglucose--hexose-1-phosphate uridylyltransferase
MIQETAGKWEKRWHPLREEWVVYAAHRNTRPWTTGLTEQKAQTAPPYDPACYLCPGNPRIHGAQNPDYQGVYIFDNDHPVVGLNAPAIPEEKQSNGQGLYRRAPAEGIARVVCFDPRHHVTLADVSVEQVAAVFRALREQMREFERHPTVQSVLIFENKGEVVGVSNPHPHGQIYAVDFVFSYVQQQVRVAEKYKQETGRNLFRQIIENEQQDEVRLVAQNKGAIAFIPFFARWAYETMIFPLQRHATLSTMTDEELHDLAAVFQEVVQRYDARFQMSFPYILSFQQAPVDGGSYPEHHFYISILPPYRQPGLLKYLAGPETGMNVFMADTIPEEKAAELRSVTL